MRMLNRWVGRKQSHLCAVTVLVFSSLCAIESSIAAGPRSRERIRVRVVDPDGKPCELTVTEVLRPIERVDRWQRALLHPRRMNEDVRHEKVASHDGSISVNVEPLIRELEVSIIHPQVTIDLNRIYRSDVGIEASVRYLILDVALLDHRIFVLELCGNDLRLLVVDQVWSRNSDLLLDVGIPRRAYDYDVSRGKIQMQPSGAIAVTIGHSVLSAAAESVEWRETIVSYLRPSTGTLDSGAGRLRAGAAF